MKHSAGKHITAFAALSMIIGILAGCTPERLPVKVLILPKFEVGEIEGDFPGEAQYFYEEYLTRSDVYEVGAGEDTDKLYYKDGIALCLTGQGKVSAALTVSAVLSDARFDFTDAYILSVGCGGCAEGYSIFGDVCVISAAADYDLGHKADVREMGSDAETTWFHDESYDESAVVRLDADLTDRVYELVKDLQPRTTEQTVRFLKKQYPDEEWADRQPQVLRGTSLTGDNYWKGRYDHQNALLIAETYGCEDPYAVTEMEDVAVGLAVKHFGMLERLIILRVGVNMDALPKGVTPEMLWGTQTEDHIASEDSLESVDIFKTGMENCLEAGKVLIEAILAGKL